MTIDEEEAIMRDNDKDEMMYQSCKVERTFERMPNYVVNKNHLKDRDEMLDDLRNMSDMVNHPPHYISENGLEVIDVIEAFTANLTGVEAVCTGNVLKYMCRWKEKNGQVDLKKAKWYLEKLISVVGEEE